MSPRVFLIVCANGPDREQVRRAITTGALDVAAGFDTVHYVVLATADRALRGLTIDSWATTSLALEKLSEWPEKAAQIQNALMVRARR